MVKTTSQILKQLKSGYTSESPDGAPSTQKDTTSGSRKSGRLRKRGGKNLSNSPESPVLIVNSGSDSQSEEKQLETIIEPETAAKQKDQKGTSGALHTEDSDSDFKSLTLISMVPAKKIRKIVSAEAARKRKGKEIVVYDGALQKNSVHQFS